MLRRITFLCFTVACLDSVNSLQTHEKIYGGENASITDYPYQLSMQSNGVHSCGATIISGDWALTSAYCSGGSVGSMSLRAGSSIAGSGGTVHTVAQKIVHAEYNSGFTDYDLALLRVSPPFVFGADTASIDLPAQDQVTEEGLDGIVSGWGKTELSLQVDGVHTCGAVIISADWALTAAQCADDADVTATTLQAGTSTLYSGGAVHQVAQKIVHSEYQPLTKDYDLALLRVLTPFEFGDGVAAIGLTYQGEITETWAKCIITGWDISRGANDTLGRFEIPIIDIANCRLTYGDAFITERMICTEVGQGYYCQNEAGNPMVVADELVGVTSWGRDCLPYYPIVGARVAEMRDWILYHCGV